jgi:ABC-2 type transport system permease protein
MAVTAALRPDRAETVVRRVSARHFVRLKLRVMVNNFRGKGLRIGLFVAGVIGGLWFAATSFVVFAAPGWADSLDAAVIVSAFGGGLLVLGWTLLPLVFFGVDETLDPARFALLPLRRRTLVLGLFASALLGVPALATLIATGGLVLTAWRLGGWVAGLVTVLGVVGGLLLCVAVSRAVTSAFAAMLRSRRVRDLAAILLAVCAALLGPLQIALVGTAERTDWHRLTGAAQVIGWTPFGAPYTAGIEIADGRAWAAPIKLLITALCIAALLWWWSRSLESAMVGTSSGGTTSARRAARDSGAPAGAVAQLFPRAARWAPRDRYGALVAREARYWWRDARRRANLITLGVVGVFVPAMTNLGGLGVGPAQQDFDASPTLLSLSMLFVGVLAAVTLANQFGFDGSAYAANVVAGVPGQLELRARVTAFSLYVVPYLVVITSLLTVFLSEPAWAGLMAGTLFAAYGVGLAINIFISILGAYALPETSNAFAISTGAGMVKGLLALVAMIASTAAAVPMVVATALLGDIWLWLALPVGLAYGLGAVLLGTYLAGDLLDRRMPELLVAVTPRR